MRPGLGIALFAVVLSASPAAAQQTLFNVPSGRVTGLGDLFFQQQFNFTRPTGSSNTTFDLGVADRLEVGFNVLDMLMYNTAPPDPSARAQTDPDLLFNAQKGFELIDDRWFVGVGGQFGFNPARRSKDVRFQNFTWVINGFELPDEWGTLYLGGYYANVAYGGPGDRFGALAGVEIPIIKDKFHFQADYISGNRDISVAVVGGVIMFPNKWQLSVGAQLPTPRSHSPYGVVIELTYPGYPLFRRNRG
ncbi:MAG: hypothetical protein K2P78_00980 [Gemmataceae bacterium]|nr:hypothetical protein [Gemmataceae bacterium]